MLFNETIVADKVCLPIDHKVGRVSGSTDYLTEIDYNLSCILILSCSIA